MPYNTSYNINAVRIATTPGSLGILTREGRALYVCSVKQGKIRGLQKCQCQKRQRFFSPQCFDLWFVQCTEVEFGFKGTKAVPSSLICYLPASLSVRPPTHLSIYVFVCRLTSYLCGWSVSWALAHNSLGVCFLRTALLSCVTLGQSPASLDGRLIEQLPITCSFRIPNRPVGGLGVI